MAGALTATNGATGNVSYQGSLILQITNADTVEQYTLSGTLGQALDAAKQAVTVIQVQYHKPFNEGIPLGSIKTMIQQIAEIFGLGQDFIDAWNTMEAEISQWGFLADIIDPILNAQIRITDIGIDTVAKNYQFGFAFDMSKQPLDLKIVPIKIAGMGLVVNKGAAS